MKLKSRVFIFCLPALIAFSVLGNLAGGATVGMPQLSAFTCDGVGEIPRGRVRGLGGAL